MPRLFLILSLLFSGVASSDEAIVGIWETEHKDVRLDILDGFKPNRGAVLLIEDGTETAVGTWETKDYDTTIQVRWRSGPVRFRGTESFEWRKETFNKREVITEDNVVALEEDRDGFIETLRRNVWLTSSEGRKSVFKSTFSNDSGVVETFSKSGDLYSLSPWGISSSILKIDNVVLVEARVSEKYLIGLDHEDDFFIFRSIEKASAADRTDLSNQRAEFFTAFLTDTWQQVRYGGTIEHKFRPIEGQLRGRDIQLSDGKLVGSSVWGYSPSTGALKIGYTEFVGGLVVGDTLALLEQDGDQTFLRQQPSGPGKVYGVSDVEAHKVNETRGNELENILSGQFQQGDYLYSFEFNEDDRTGFVHKWQSAPFTIAGHELSSELLHRTKTVFALEEFLFFDEHFFVKRDATASRLRPKSEEEVAQDQQAMKDRLDTLGQTRLVLRVTEKGGRTQDISLPIESMTEITSIEILTRKE